MVDPQEYHGWWTALGKNTAPMTGISWGQADLDLNAELDRYCAMTGAAKSIAIKMVLRAVVEHDDETLKRFRYFSRPGALRPAGARSALA